jgi:hypothetical protein
MCTIQRERTKKMKDGEHKAHEKSMESVFADVGGNSLREHEEDGTGSAASDVLRDLP